MKHANATTYLALVAATICSGSMYVFVKSMGGTLHPIVIAFFRFSIAAVFMLPFAVRKLQWPRRRDIGSILVVSLLCGAISTLTSSWATTLSTPGNVATIVNANPLFILALAPLLISERVNWKMVIGMLIGFTGLYLVVFQGFHLATFVDSQYLKGNLIALIAPVAIAFGTIYQKQHIHTYGVFTMTVLPMFVSSIVLAFVLAFSGVMPPLAIFNSRLILLLLGLGTVGTIVPFVLYNKGIKRLGVSRTASFKLLIPIFTALLAWLLLSQTITWYTFFCMLLSIIGIAIVNSFQDIVKIEMEQKI